MKHKIERKKERKKKKREREREREREFRVYTKFHPKQSLTIQKRFNLKKALKYRPYEMPVFLRAQMSISL